MFDKKTGSPLDLEKELGPDPDLKAEVSADNTYSISIENVNGLGVINWTASTVGEYDWVGLYGGPDIYYENYILWKWVENTTSFPIEAEAKSGWQARYLVWVSDSGEYVTVATSNLVP